MGLFKKDRSNCPLSNNHGKHFWSTSRISSLFTALVSIGVAIYLSNPAFFCVGFAMKKWLQEDFFTEIF